jgi:hypothetical protein
LSGKITNEFGPRVPMTAGMAMMGIGLFVLALNQQGSSPGSAGEAAKV